MTHLWIKLDTCDDILFGQVNFSNISNIINFTTTRYNVWSSRILIELVLVPIVKAPPIIWQILDSALIVLIARLLSYLFTKDNLRCKILSILVTVIMPFIIMNTAGWGATTLNYLWPLAALLVTAIPIKHTLIGKKDPLWILPLYSLCLLFACNQEQSCLICLGFYVLFSAYFTYYKKRPKFIYFQTFLSILSLIFIATCPGNFARTASEINTWYPAFMNFNSLQKLMLGINGTFAQIIVKGNILYLILAVVIIFATAKMKPIVRYISWIPLAPVIITHIFPEYLSILFPILKNLQNNFFAFAGAPVPIGTETPILETIDITYTYNLLITVLALSSFASIIYCLYHILHKDKDRVLIPIVFLAGVLSIIIMGFSPTIYASSSRIFTFFNCATAICILTICSRQLNTNNTFVILAILAALQSMSLLSAIL